MTDLDASLDEAVDEDAVVYKIVLDVLQNPDFKYILLLKAETDSAEQVVFTLDGEELIPGTKEFERAPFDEEVKGFFAYTYYYEHILRDENNMKIANFRSGKYCAMIDGTDVSSCLVVKRDTGEWGEFEPEEPIDKTFHYRRPSFSTIGNNYNGRCENGETFYAYLSGTYYLDNGNPLVHRIDEFTPKDYNGQLYLFGVPYHPGKTNRLETLKPIEYGLDIKSDHKMTVSLCENDYHCEWCVWSECSKEQLACLNSLINCAFVDINFRCYPSYLKKEVWQYGTETDDMAKDVLSGKDGDLYISGTSDGDISLDGSADSYDIFLEKRTKQGERKWIKQWGSADNDFLTESVQDADGNIYLVGDTSGSFNGIENSGSRIFVMKVDSDGNELWTKLFGENGANASSGVAINAKGDRLFVGAYLCNGYSCGDIRVLNTENGDLIDTFSWKTNDNIGLYDVQVDDKGYIYLTGKKYKDNINVTNTFLVKLDPYGEKVWSKIIGSPDSYEESSFGRSIIVKKNGEIMLAGITWELFSNMSGELLYNGDVFTILFDSDGNFITGRVSGTEFIERVTNFITDDDESSFYILGFSSALDPGPKNAFYMNTKFDSSIYLYSHLIDTDGYDYVYDGVFWRNEEQDLLELFLVGSTSGTFEGQQNAGDYDAYVLRTSVETTYNGPQ
ncbi:MAG TPA: hypothetical protein VLJ60_11835 [bacterium]|nr:hypothetical protein [bacterium]